MFLLSLKAGGTGLNLTRADHVIHFDRWWNPAVEDQATDRAYRIGQTRAVQVHRLLTEGTIEQRIGVLLQRKRDLAESVLGSGEVALTELSNDELRDLVTLRVPKGDRRCLTASTSPSSAPASSAPPPPASSRAAGTRCCSSSSTPSATTAAAPTAPRGSTAGPTPTRSTSRSPAAPTTSGRGSRTSPGLTLRTRTGGLDAGAGHARTIHDALRAHGVEATHAARRRGRRALAGHGAGRARRASTPTPATSTPTSP